MKEGPFRVRVFEIGDKTKKTLVITHGFSGCALSYYTMIHTLAKSYRLVLFDNCSWGLNTRVQTCEGLESPVKAEAWLIDWLVKVFDKLDLPEKFFLAGHSMGGYLMSLYASTAPQKVGGLFLLSPAGTEPYDPVTYDPYNILHPFQLKPMTRK